MSDLVTKYPLDLTGVNPTNKIEGEIRELSPGINRSVVPRYGAFYYDQLQIRDLDSNQILVPNDQFVPIMFHQPATERSGKEVFGGVVIVDTTVSNNLAIDYQAVGGEYQDIVPLILDIIDNLNLDNRTVAWGDLLGRPDAFAPAPHLHDVGDVYGFEYLVESINAVREAILLGDQGVFDELRAQIEARHATAMQGIADLTSDFNDHESNFANPHSVNKVQVGLGNVENYPIATQSEGETGTATNRYMTPLRTKQAITIQIGNAFNAHRADRDNPHVVTKAQVGLGSVENYPIASLAEAEAGTASNRYMTPQRTAQAIQEQAGGTLGSHTSNTSNPHSVTKAQVGLGSVENLTLASQVEAQAGTSNSRYMTPLRTQQAIMTLAGNALSGHTSNTSNPHNVTKTQVGLGSVENLGLASQAEAQAGTSNAKYMTPLRTTQAIMQQAGAALGGHTGNTNNPHSVTKAQVGLGNVTNDRQVKRAGDTMTGDLSFEQTNRGLVWSMNTDGAAIVFHSTSDSDPDARLEFQTRDNETEYFRWVAATNTGAVLSEWMTLKKLGLIVNGRVTATAFYGNGANLTGMSKSQVGLANVENYVVATQSEAQTGSRNDRYMTPLRTAQAITQQAGAALSGHTGATNNPHSVTKAQVGLGNVDNIASTTTATADRIVRRDSSGDIQARLFRSEYDVTNANVGFIMTQVDTGTNNFIRPSTPAQVKAALGVTKSDVGLSQVQNLDLANQAEAEAGTVNNKYMTPLRTKQAITQLAGAAVASHINNTNNPHNVTKAQIGLGNVENYNRAHYDGRYLQRTGGEVTGPLIVDVVTGIIPDSKWRATSGGLENWANRKYTAIVSSSDEVTSGLLIKSFATNSANEPTAIHAINHSGATVFSVNAITGLASSSTDFLITSDKRVKENLVKLTSVSDKLKEINGYYYNRKDVDTDRRRIGVLAQEVCEVYPELVNVDEDGYMSVSYSRMVTVLLEGLKEQATKHDALVDMLLDSGTISERP